MFPVRFPARPFSLRPILAAALIAVLPVTAAQSAIDPQRQPEAAVKGWTAVAGMSGPAVLQLARTLPVTTEAAGDGPWCDSAATVRGALKAEFEEDLVTRRADGTQLWGSDTMGTWTVVLARADGTQCVIASGIGYEDGANPLAYYAKVGLS